MFARGRVKKGAPPRPGGFVRWERERCLFCAGCVPVCDAGAMTVTESRLEVDASRCRACGACVRGCPTGALSMGIDLDARGREGR